MTDCRGRLEELSALIDGELGVEEEIGLRRHLDGCDECAAWRSQLDALSRRIATCAGRERAPHALVAQLAQLRQPSGWRRPALAAGAAGLLGGVVLLGHAGEDRESALFEDHHRLVSGATALAVESSDPKVVVAGLGPKLPFHIAVAEVEDAEIRGGHACSLPGGPAAYLQYERGGERVSVFVSPTPTAPRDTSAREACKQVEGEAVCTYIGPRETVAIVASRPEMARPFRQSARIVKSPQEFP
jgi:anti-sigma factor RsiW